MTRHLLKLVWNRKRTNTLIVLEIFCSFLVVFGLAAAALHFLARYRQPLGFDYSSVWYVDVARNTGSDWGDWEPEEAATFARLLTALESLDGVEAAAGCTSAPYMGASFIHGWSFRGQDMGAEVSYVTPGFIDVLRPELVSGRWIDAADSALDWTAIVVDEALAAELVGDEDPLGQRVTDVKEGEDDLRVVGVVRDYRRGGELDENTPYLFASARLDRPADAQALRTLVVRLAPGTPADLEQPLLETLAAIAPDWSFNVVHVEQAREDYLRAQLLPLASLGVIAGFLLLMVVLGLTGVMWQNVTRRTREIGLRRAAGAHRARIQRQIVGEVAVTAGLGLALGLPLVLQVPLIGPFTFVPFAVVVPATIVSALLILLLAMLCGLYPGWSATRIRPAEALHYE
jgi:putative ABC transport system permease protein